jgi:hypothetical protein
MKKIIGLLIISVFVLSLSLSFAAPVNTNAKSEIAKLMLEFEKSIGREFMSRSWKNKRASWIAFMSKRNISLEDYKKGLLTLDQNIVMEAFKTAYRKDISTWPIYVTTSNSITSISSALLEINQNLKHTSRKSWWFKKSALWIKKAKLYS